MRQDKSSEKGQINATQIRQARVLLRMRQADLAEAAGVAPATISQIETGKTTPHGSTLIAIREALERRGVVFTNGQRPTCYLDLARAIIPL